jgi:hypothetical protein
VGGHAVDFSPADEAEAHGFVYRQLQLARVHVSATQKILDAFPSVDLFKRSGDGSLQTITKSPFFLNPNADPVGRVTILAPICPIYAGFQVARCRFRFVSGSRPNFWRDVERDRVQNARVLTVEVRSERASQENCLSP